MQISYTLAYKESLHGILLQKGSMWLALLELIAYESAVCYWGFQEPFFQREVDVVGRSSVTNHRLFLGDLIFPAGLITDVFNYA